MPLSTLTVSIFLTAACSTPHGANEDIVVADDALGATSSVNVFHADSCTGPMLTQDRALEYLTSADTVTIGRYKVFTREQVCASGQCVWLANDTIPYVISQRWIATTTFDATPVVRTGKVILRRAAATGLVQLVLEPDATPGDVRYTLVHYLPSSFRPAPTKYPLSVRGDLTTSASHAIALGYGRASDETFSLPAEALSVKPESTEPTGVMTDHCLRIGAEEWDRDNTVQSVFYATFAPPGP